MSIESIEIDHLRSWIGREEEVAEDEASVDRHLPERVMRTFETGRTVPQLVKAPVVCLVPSGADVNSPDGCLVLRSLSEHACKVGAEGMSPQSALPLQASGVQIGAKNGADA